MPDISILLGRIIAFSLFGAGMAYFSNSPSYTYHDPDKALVMISFSHASQRKEDCRTYSPEEISALAPNMRRPADCPRERVSLGLELVVDGNILTSKSYRPTGLAKDGAVSVYESIPLAAGEHEVLVKMRDSRRESGFDYSKAVSVTLAPRQLLVIDFRKELDGFIIK